MAKVYTNYNRAVGFGLNPFALNKSKLNAVAFGYTENGSLFIRGNKNEAHRMDDRDIDKSHRL